MAKTTNPYYIWLSEVMLQIEHKLKQLLTRLSSFCRTISNCGSFETKLRNTSVKVLEGLGYYSRARNFHTAIKEVHDKYEGLVPKDPDQMKALKVLAHTHKLQ